VIAALGLRELRKPSQTGLRALMALAQIDISRPISTTDIGFRLAPRINAAGRMDIASDVVELFLAKDPALAKTLAEKLHRLNDERRASEAGALRSIEAAIEAMSLSEAGLPAALVLDDSQSSTWHRGVIGILASRVVDRAARPALVITHEDGQAYGSGRSVRGFHLLDALTSINSMEETALLTRFGGHAYAVGFSLPSSRVEELRRRMEVYTGTHLPSTDEAQILDCDAELQLSELTPQFLALLEQLGPFGIGNPEPLFISYGVRLVSAPRVVKERHLRLQVEDDDSGQCIGGMAWARQTDWAAEAQRESWKQGDQLDLAYRLRHNWHPDFGGWELEIVSMRSHQTDSHAKEKLA
jgi:single-stranded-DNA-specific exonuclease